MSVIRVLEWSGYNLGKWIYMIDAFDDLEGCQVWKLQSSPASIWF